MGHKLFFDNYFTSLPLLREMCKKIFAASTVRSNRCEKCPLKTEKELKKSGRGSSDCVVSADGNIAITRWMDNRAVTLHPILLLSRRKIAFVVGTKRKSVSWT